MKYGEITTLPTKVISSSKMVDNVIKMNTPLTNNYVGHWIIGGPMGLKFSLVKKPRWLTRVFMKLVAEWEWSDKLIGHWDKM